MKINFNQRWYEEALEEQRERAPYMLTKFADTAARKAGQIRGLVIEHHVTGWFRQNYPNNFMEAENYRQWTKVCSHDFKLILGNELYRIDVTGPRKDGTFGSYSQKPKYGVDYHILCHALGFRSWDNCDFEEGFRILGVLTPENYRSDLDNNKIIDFSNWLNNIGL